MVVVIRRRWVRAFLFGWSLCVSGIVHAQSNKPDTLIIQHALGVAINTYNSSIGVESHLYNGVLYKEYNAHNTDQGQPYFLTDEWAEGSVFYDGERYDSVPMLFDLVREKLVIDHHYAGIKLELISDKISSFQLSGHSFIRLVSSGSGSVIQTGFYDVTYDGTIKTYVRRLKLMTEAIEAHEVTVSFEESNRYFIYKNGIYYQVKTKSSVLDVLEDRKADIKKFIRKNKIKFRKNRVTAIAQIAAFYDQPALPQ